RGAQALRVDVVVRAERLEPGQHELEVEPELVHVPLTNGRERYVAFDADGQVADRPRVAREPRVHLDQPSPGALERFERVTPRSRERIGRRGPFLDVDADAEPGDAAADRGAELTRLEGPRVEARRVTGIGTRGGFEEQGEVRAARAERADVQHRRGGGEPDPLERNAPVGRLEPEHARVRGGDAERA